MRHALLILWIFALGGCRSAAVGDPCIPESVPPDGFKTGEAYLETSSVQCRTRTCIVYQFGATAALDPTNTQEECLRNNGDPGTCAVLPTEETVEERVYCTCRCSSLGNSNTPTCECPGGFECVDNLLTLGGEGIQGGYCVRKTTIPEDT